MFDWKSHDNLNLEKNRIFTRMLKTCCKASVCGLL